MYAHRPPPARPVDLDPDAETSWGTRFDEKFVGLTWIYREAA
jgi:hypothetical protein